MPQSLLAVYIHLVFSTKERRALLGDETVRTLLHFQLGGISKKLGCAPIITGGGSYPSSGAFWPHNYTS
jgi:putative transposase